MSSPSPLHKTDFGAIYDQPDPRAYFETLEPFDYLIPQYGAELFTRILEAQVATRDRPARVLDVSCSYGIVATMLKTTLDLSVAYAHYRDAGERGLTRNQLIAADRLLIEEHLRPEAPEVIGLDVAANALNYALANGSLDAGVIENLEVDAPSAELAALLQDVDLVTITGGVGYVTERTFGRLLDATTTAPWVAAFCLRTYDYAPIIDTLSAHGLQTERLPRTFPQRRFTGADEQRWAIAEVRARGLDPAGKEATGFFHADFFLSRPAADVERIPLTHLIEV